MKTLIVHPVFSIYGGGEKVMKDICSLLKKDYEVRLFTLFKTEHVKGIPCVEGQFIEKPSLFSVFGYKINPFTAKYVKKLGMLLAKAYSQGDKIVLSLFPSTLILEEAMKHNKEITYRDVTFICFEPDRILYYDDHIKYDYMPYDLRKWRFWLISKFLSGWRGRDRAVVKNIKKIITLSDYVTGMTRKIYNAPHASTGLCMYVDLKNLKKENLLQARKALNGEYALNLKDDDFVILALSRLEYSKGLRELMLVLEELEKRQLKYHALIGGTGSLYPWLKKKEKKNPRLKALGFIPGKLQNLFYSSGDAFLFLGKKETGGPLTVLEAMYNGNVVVASNDGGPAELIKDREDGYLVESHDIKRIADVLEHIAKTSKQQEMDQMRKKAVLHVREEHSFEKFSTLVKEAITR